MRLQACGRHAYEVAKIERRSLARLEFDSGDGLLHRAGAAARRVAIATEYATRRPLADGPRCGVGYLHTENVTVTETTTLHQADEHCWMPSIGGGRRKMFLSKGAKKIPPGS